MKKKVIILTVIILLVGCIGGQVVKPQTPLEVVAYQHATLTGLYNQVAYMLTTGVLSPEEGELILDDLDEAWGYINRAEFIIVEDRPGDYQNQIALAQDILHAVSAILTEKEAEHGGNSR